MRKVSPPPQVKQCNQFAEKDLENLWKQVLHLFGLPKSDIEMEREKFVTRFLDHGSVWLDNWTIDTRIGEVGSAAIDLIYIDSHGKRLSDDKILELPYWGLMWRTDYGQTGKTTAKELEDLQLEWVSLKLEGVI
jgi:hypothetical protein